MKNECVICEAPLEYLDTDHKRCTITKEMVPDIIDYINMMCKGEPIDIGWFGGEPLIGSNRISQICKGLRHKGIKYRSKMVSNGYLFDNTLIKKAKDEWNLISVQITLDGTEDVYNSVKAYINPKENPFKKVLNNIEKLLENGIAVIVRLNVTNENAADLDNLINELTDRFKGKRGFSCYSHAIYDGVGFEPLTYDDSIRKLVDIQTVLLDKKIKERELLGSYSRLPAMRIRQCMADNDSCRIIYPDGVIGKCENKSSLEGIGDIYNDIIDQEMDNRYKATEEFLGCSSCFLYPDCVNLKVCPETGHCSNEKISWSKEIYSALMMKLYGEKQNKLLTDIDENELDQCNS